MSSPHSANTITSSPISPKVWIRWSGSSQDGPRAVTCTDAGYRGGSAPRTVNVSGWSAGPGLRGLPLTVNRTALRPAVDDLEHLLVEAARLALLERLRHQRPAAGHPDRDVARHAARGTPAWAAAWSLDGLGDADGLADSLGDGLSVAAARDSLGGLDAGADEVALREASGVAVVTSSPSPRVSSQVPTSATATTATPSRTQKPRSGVGAPVPGSVCRPTLADATARGARRRRTQPTTPTTREPR